MSQIFDPAVPRKDTQVEPTEIRNQFLAIASHFSGITAPNTGSSLIAQSWFNTDDELLYIYRGNAAFEYVVQDQPHSALAGLLQDNHPQYLLANGARAAAGLTITQGFKVDKLDLSLLAEGLGTTGNLLSDGSFEALDTNLVAVPPMWNLIGAPTLATDVSSSGGNGQSLKVTSLSSNEGVAQILQAKPSRMYTVALKLKASVGNEARIVVEAGISGTTWTELSSNAYTDGVFDRKVQDVFVPSYAKYLRINLTSTSSIGSAWFDEVSVNEGNIYESAKTIEQSDDSFIRVTNYQTTAPANRGMGNLRIEHGTASYTMPAVARVTKLITFPRAFSHFLGATATLSTTTSSAVLVSSHAGTTAGVILEFRSTDGSDISETGECYWMATGLDNDV